MTTALPTPEQDVSIWLGLRCVNLTAEPVRLNFFHVFPELLDAAGKCIPAGYNQNTTEMPKSANYPIVLPGRRRQTFLRGNLRCYLAWEKLKQDQKKEFFLAIETKQGGSLVFEPLKPGRYFFRYRYAGMTIDPAWRTEISPNQLLSWEPIWTGQVVTPPIAFDLI
jgi:hypothetical protein